MKFEKEFRKAHPETVGEVDSNFDLDNYAEYLESLVEEKLTSKQQTQSKISEDYNELLMAVENKYPGESRHQSALRLIKGSQNNSGIGSQKLSDVR